MRTLLIGVAIVVCAEHVRQFVWARRGTPAFGTVTSAAEPRLIQMGIKLTF